MPDIPTTPDELTPTWLTYALRQWGGAGAVTVVEARPTPLPGNEGFYGHVVRVHLRYAGAASAAPRTLIAKLSSPVAEMRARAADSYRREVRFYQTLANTGAGQTPLAVPTCYFAAMDEPRGWHVILLQDLAPLRAGSRAAGCTVDQARTALAAIVQLHLRWWGAARLPDLAWAAGEQAPGDADQARRQYEAQYEAWWATFYAQARELLPAPLAASSAQLGPYCAAVRYHVFGGGTPCTLIHRDFQLGNLLFAAGQGEARAPTPGETAAGTLDFAVVDWQFVSRGLGVWDVAYFLSENLRPDDRRQVELALLRDYHRTLVQQGIDDYGFDQCYDDYCLALIQRHVALVATLATMPFTPEQRQLHREILLPRNLAALQDHAAFARLAQWGAQQTAR